MEKTEEDKHSGEVDLVNYEASASSGFDLTSKVLINVRKFVTKWTIYRHL